jgi:isopentenyl-diphosphate delta-isomerase
MPAVSPYVEEVTLVNELGCAIGSMEKLRAHREGKLHLAFSIFIFDNQGNVLLQKRAQEKYHSSGLWSNSCCGHPRPAESLRDAAERRLREEFGIFCELQPAFHFIYETQFHNDLIEHEYDYVMVGHFQGVLHPDPSEIESYVWVEAATLQARVAAVPKQFTFWLKKIIQMEEWSTLLHRQLSPVEGTRI